MIPNRSTQASARTSGESCSVVLEQRVSPYSETKGMAISHMSLGEYTYIRRQEDIDCTCSLWKCASERCEIQGDVVVEDGHQSAHLTQETTQFIDESTGLRVGVDEQIVRETLTDQTQNLDLVRFLSRPVRIAQFTWSESDAIGTTYSYNPWQLFFNDARIKYKINNFAFLQCKLKIKVLINASPFYYGAMIGAYIPNQGFTPSTIQNDTATRYFIPLSQRPHMWIYAQGSKADEITLPFFYHKNWLNIQSSADLANMGQLDFVNYTTLASANGAVGVGVSVQVYAWAEDVQLSGPSVGLAMQGDDEYGQGAVSGPASAVARGARWFENIPIIGRFATATRIGAGAIGAIASLFGFTNVPVISDHQPYRPVAFPQLASTEIGHPVEKLTVDSKNELTVDPCVLGLPNDDELTIKHLCTRESYLTTATWKTTNSVDDILFSSNVTPTMFDNDGAAQSKVYQIPLCWIAQMFKHWRGDIIFRFKFIASPYHKGRVRISYDPSSNIIADAISQTVVSTTIVDLGEETDCEIRIPYQQATAFQQVRPGLTTSSIGWSTSLTPPFSHNPILDNGMITVRVQTVLTAPVVTSEVPILVFVRGAENIEFANPAELIDTSYFQVQADAVYGDPKTVVAGTAPSRPLEERYLVNFGERIVSLRQLLRRQSLLSVSMMPLDSTDYHQLYTERFTKYPPCYGYDPNGTDSAFGIVAPLSTFKFNYNNVTPWNWLAPAFVGQRGSIQYTFNIDSVVPLNHARVYRNTQNIGANSNNSSVQLTRGTNSSIKRFYKLRCPAGASGHAITNQVTNAGLVVQCPNYSKFRYMTTTPGAYTRPTSNDGGDIDAYVLELATTPSTEPKVNAVAKIWKYTGIGTDYGLYFFLNVPTVWIYSIAPLAN
jgi:hypothetical protein